MCINHQRAASERTCDDGELSSEPPEEKTKMSDGVQVTDEPSLAIRTFSLQWVLLLPQSF